MDIKPSVAIFDADAPGALAFARSLGRAGVPTRVFSHRLWPVARFSRYCTSFERCPDPEDTRAFLPWLKAKLEAKEIDLVAPTSDLIAYCVAELYDTLDARWRGQSPAPQAVFTTLFKDRFDAACARAGFHTPKTYYPASVAEAHELAHDITYPAVLKPKTHVAVGWARGCLVESPDELKAHYQPYAIPDTRRPVSDRYPDLVLPLIQEYVPGTLDGLYSVSGLLNESGEAVAVAASRKLAQWPPALGIGIEFEATHNEALIKTGLTVARSVLGSGLFELELIWDERLSQWLAIDLNPRAHGFISFDVARHNDLPLLWYQLATGERIAPTSTAADGVNLRWVHSLPRHVSRWVDLLRGPNRVEQLRALLSSEHQKQVDIVNDPDDPLPTAAFMAMMLRHPGGLIRPFWQGTSARLKKMGRVGSAVLAVASSIDEAVPTAVLTAVKLGESL